MTTKCSSKSNKKKRESNIWNVWLFLEALWGVTFMSLCYYCWPSFKYQLSVLSDDHVALVLLTFVTVKVSFFPAVSMLLTSVFTSHRKSDWSYHSHYGNNRFTMMHHCTLQTLPMSNYRDFFLSLKMKIKNTQPDSNDK